MTYCTSLICECLIGLEFLQCIKVCIEQSEVIRYGIYAVQLYIQDQYANSRLSVQTDALHGFISAGILLS